MHDALGVLHRP